MAPLKFEDKIKEKLEQRAIKPSEGSWEKLSGQLDQEQNPTKRNKGIWWYSLAAVFVGVLILSSILYKSPTADQIDPQFVEHDKEMVKEKDTQIVQENDAEKQNVVEIENVIVDNRKTETEIIVNSANKIPAIAKKNEHQSNHGVDSKVTSKDRAEQENVAIKIANHDEEKNNVLEQKEVLSINPEVINTKVADVLAQVKELQKNNTEVTDEEIDKLLRKAQRDITTNRILESKTVSASALLQEVEEEIDETFKQRVFEALKTGFQKVKTAVVDREN